MVSKFADELIEKLIRGETTYEEYTQMVIDYFTVPSRSRE